MRVTGLIVTFVLAVVIPNGRYESTCLTLTCSNLLDIVFIRFMSYYLVQYLCKSLNRMNVIEYDWECKENIKVIILWTD